MSQSIPEELPHADPETIPQPPLAIGSDLDKPIVPELRETPDPAKPVPTEAEEKAPGRGPIGATGFARNYEAEGTLIHPVKEVPDVQYSSAEATKENPNPMPPSGDLSPL